ncbi:MAG: sensor domain-containing diguanylate cyclase [Thauera sp.]|nr:sensor domain-containing diguanylate cyclase [Thauera sp.]
MHAPPLPPDESRRIETLRALNILDTAPEERFDRLTRLAKRLFNVPIALVSLVDTDRQWFKSCMGLAATETTRDVSFCGHTILDDDTLVVADAALDPRFADNPLVTGPPGIRFYAGCPLRAANGSKLGTLCVIDTAPRSFGADDLALLRDLAHMAEQELAAVQLASMDELTLLSNRRGFERLAQQALNMCRRMGKPAAMLYVDLDLFKQINDRFGHAEGDRALADFARLLRETFREVDVIGRLGGDEFAVLVTNADEHTLAEPLARLSAAVHAHNSDAARGYALRYSVGAAQFAPERHPGVTELMAAADARMYAQKQLGRKD